ncbi:transposase [Streptomyces milbemycinicus]|uniref:transposase n=1 Tax=Streptomyces milbemycinicus TaxID=476552 RepID=UPI0033DC929E
MPEPPLLACTFRGHATSIPKVRQYDAQVRRQLWGGHFWFSSYVARSCIGAPLTVVRQYIENQQRPV